VINTKAKSRQTGQKMRSLDNDARASANQG
jgi:hypothetical protein